jgi:hypothetical protein
VRPGAIDFDGFVLAPVICFFHLNKCSNNEF